MPVWIPVKKANELYIRFLLGDREPYLADDCGILKSRGLNKLLHNNPDKFLNQRRLYKNSDRNSGRKSRWSQKIKTYIGIPLGAGVRATLKLLVFMLISKLIFFVIHWYQAYYGHIFEGCKKREKKVWKNIRKTDKAFSPIGCAL